MTANAKPDQAAARRIALATQRVKPPCTCNVCTVSRAYLELRELAKAVLKVADRDTDVFNALRAAIGEEHG